MADNVVSGPACKAAPRRPDHANKPDREANQAGVYAVKMDAFGRLTLVAYNRQNTVA